MARQVEVRAHPWMRRKKSASHPGSEGADVTSFSEVAMGILIHTVAFLATVVATAELGWDIVTSRAAVSRARLCLRVGAGIIE